MMQLKTILLSLILVPFILKGQHKISATDSIQVKKQLEDFYSWYATAIRNHQINEKFNPVFARMKNGMTTLDFKNYKEALKKHNFSAKLINERVANYNECVKNLLSIPYDSIGKFELDDEEKIKCDFSNTYEWGIGMEPVAGGRVMTMNERNHAIEVVVEIISNDGQAILGTRTFTLENHRHRWEITGFK